MPIRTNGGVFNTQMLTGSLVHYVVCGANFSGAINSFGKPVPNSAAEIIFNRIEAGAYVNIMNPNECNLSFALEADRSIWNETSLTIMVQGLGSDVGIDHIDCTLCTVKEVPYVWGSCNPAGATSFLDLTDTPAAYAGSAGYVVSVNSLESGLIFAPATSSNAFAFAASPSQLTIPAVGSDTLTFVAGSNVNITTNALAKSITINSTAGTDYIPIPPGTNMLVSTKYFVTSTGTVTLPILTGMIAGGGESVVVTKPVGVSIFITVGQPSDIIKTDLGDTDTIEFDATQQVIFVASDANTWNLQIGSAV
jgi:hypothetical protein